MCVRDPTLHFQRYRSELQLNMSGLRIRYLGKRQLSVEAKLL
jgi:hypothetical protein